MSQNWICRIGTAGWVVPRTYAGKVAEEGSHLERYAKALNCVEINSTFYRLPREKTLARWAESTPKTFRFSVKMPKSITHEKMLRRCGSDLVKFFDAARYLDSKLGPVLVQLPPKLAFDQGTADEFFTTLREAYVGQVVLEPRHVSWFSAAADQMLRGFQISRAMADPPAGSPAAGAPGGWHGLRYFRLHGSPRRYWSEYDEAFLSSMGAIARSSAAETWIIFDNTAQGHALGNALRLQEIESGKV